MGSRPSSHREAVGSRAAGVDGGVEKLGEDGRSTLLPFTGTKPFGSSTQKTAGGGDGMVGWRRRMGRSHGSGLEGDCEEGVRERWENIADGIGMELLGDARSGVERRGACGRYVGWNDPLEPVP